LEVADLHTYFVASAGILVHNAGKSIAAPSIEDLSKAAGVPDRGGLTAAGRSLTKHGAGARPSNTLFPPAKGNPATINQTAQNIVDDILTTPGTTTLNSTRGRFGPTIEMTAPDGRGIVYDANGNFLFFKE
jgi:filamentous hemagglutinin